MLKKFTSCDKEIWPLFPALKRRIHDKLAFGPGLKHFNTLLLPFFKEVIKGQFYQKILQTFGCTLVEEFFQRRIYLPNSALFGKLCSLLANCAIYWQIVPSLCKWILQISAHKLDAVILMKLTGVLFIKCSVPTFGTQSLVKSTPREKNNIFLRK